MSASSSTLADTTVKPHVYLSSRLGRPESFRASRGFSWTDFLIANAACRLLLHPLRWQLAHAGMVHLLVAGEEEPAGQARGP